MRADTIHAMRVKSSLAASEQAERDGHPLDAIRHAQDTLQHADAWLQELYRVTPEACVHGVLLDRECSMCAKIADDEAHIAEAARWNGMIALHNENA